MGRSGERFAEKYLKRKKYIILERNFTTKIGEVDLIARTKDIVVFVEVKTRGSNSFGQPGEAVDHNKQNKYRLVASQYCKYKGILNVPIRFDVIEILDGEINHIENAF